MHVLWLLRVDARILVAAQLLDEAFGFFAPFDNKFFPAVMNMQDHRIPYRQNTSLHCIELPPFAHNLGLGRQGNWPSITQGRARAV